MNLIKYITCEGRSIIVFNYHFTLLNHLRHQKLPYFMLRNINDMDETFKMAAHPETCVTNHGLIKLIVLDALNQKGMSSKDFKRKRPRTSQGKQDGTLGEIREEARSQTWYSKVGIEKRPLDKPIGDKRPKQRVKVNMPAEPSSTTEEQEEAEELKEE